MSDKGIFTALSGAMAQNKRLETIANNLANVNTPAFKKDRQIFREYLTSYEKLPDVIQVPRVPASVESFYDMQGGDKSFVDPNGTYSNHDQGSLKATGDPFDLAIEGKGLFEVLTPDGLRLTRAGNFKLDSSGRLVTASGHPVLRTGEAAQNPEERVIQWNNVESSSLTISSDGRVVVNGEELGQISLLDVENTDALSKVGTSYFAINNDETANITQATDYKLHQGFLESSNVNLIQEMTEMIRTTRSFESAQKAIKAYDQMKQKLIADVPRTNR